VAWKQPAIVFVIALAVRLVHLWQMREAPFFSVLLGDSRGYDEWARRIAAGEWLGTDVFYQAPLYPYFLAVIYWAAAVAGKNVTHASPTTNPKVTVRIDSSFSELMVPASPGFELDLSLGRLDSDLLECSCLRWQLSRS